MISEAKESATMFVSTRKRLLQVARRVFVCEFAIVVDFDLR